MQLLNILVQKRGETVTREELVTTIWQDYGGDEGLTQAISILRKTLLDNKKELIQTVPKKGYILKASITYKLDTVEAKKNIKNL